MTVQPQGQGLGPDEGSGIGSRVLTGLRKGAKGLWMLLSLVLYGLGIVLYNAGRFLMGVSGWQFGRDK